MTAQFFKQPIDKRVAAFAVMLPYLVVYATSWRAEWMPSHEILLSLLIYGIPVGSALLIVYGVGVRPEVLGFRNPFRAYRARDAAAIQFLIFLAFKSSILIYVVLVMSAPDSWHEGLIDFKQSAGWTSIESIFNRIIFAPFTEELFFRAVPAFLLGAISGGFVARILYVVLSATLFALFHIAYGISASIVTFYVGLVAALIYLRIKNIWFLIAAHSISNI